MESFAMGSVFFCQVVRQGAGTGVNLLSFSTHISFSRFPPDTFIRHRYNCLKNNTCKMYHGERIILIVLRKLSAASNQVGNPLFHEEFHFQPAP
jgi:hypothetical protein